MDQVEIMATISADFKNEPRDKFLIQAVEVKHSHNWNDITAVEAMKRVPKSAVQTEIKLPVTITKAFPFEKESNNNEKILCQAKATSLALNSYIKEEKECY